MDERTHPKTKTTRANLGLTAAVCAVFVAGMVGASFAAVPLYRIFCQVTGYGGTIRQATAAPTELGDRVVTVRFDANIANDLGWSFRPLQRQVKIRLGEVGQVSFLAENRTSHTETGRAVFNVAPDAVGAYFNKIACFCFTDQTLAPGQSTELGVTFFVDPAYAKDRDLETTNTITLSYTFFPAKGAQQAAAADVPVNGNAL
jgi:cytochrome c oxidase assembly protein subunit 11